MKWTDGADLKRNKDLGTCQSTQKMSESVSDV